MAIYGLTGVHIGDKGRIERVRMQPVDGATNEWIGEPREFEAHEAANFIAVGDEIYSIFISEGDTVLGPKFKRATYENGVESIELQEDIEGKRIQDLLQF